MTAPSQCRRALATALTAVLIACPGAPEAPSPETLHEPETAIIATDGAVKEAEATVAEIVATDVLVADVAEAAVEAEVVAEAVADAPWLASTISVVDGRVAFSGLPGVSADGMHLALVDEDAGRVAIDVTRLDGQVLVDKVLREAREQDMDPATLQRRFKARIAQAHKVLAKAGMHALTRTTFAARGSDYVVQVPGAEPVTVSRASLDLPCGRATGIASAFVDREHGVVVVSVTRDGDCATDKARHDWHVVTFASAPGAEAP